MTITVANAPISYGAFELTVGIDPNVPDGVAILDEEALLAAAAYIDLNLAAGLAAAPKVKKHTSVQARLAHLRATGQLESVKADIEALKHGALPKPKRGAKDPEAGLWLCPIENRRARDARARAGMMEDLTLAHYLALLDYSRRLLSKGKAPMPVGLAEIFERLDTSSDAWQARLTKLANGRLLGRFAAGSGETLKRAAKRIGSSKLWNIQS